MPLGPSLSSGDLFGVVDFFGDILPIVLSACSFSSLLIAKKIKQEKKYVKRTGCEKNLHLIFPKEIC